MIETISRPIRLSPNAVLALERVDDGLEDRIELWPDEYDNGYGGDGDQGDEQAVLDHALS